MAKEWRKVCGDILSGEIPQRAASSFKSLKKASRVKWPEWLRDGKSHCDLRPLFRKLSRKLKYIKTLSMAEEAIGIRRSLLPLPRMRICFFSKLMQFSGKDTSSDTRSPQAYISSIITESRCQRESEESRAVDMSCLISAAERYLGRGLCCLGERILPVGKALICFSEYRNLKYSRKVESLRAMVLGANPWADKPWINDEISDFEMSAGDWDG